MGVCGIDIYLAFISTTPLEYSPIKALEQGSAAFVLCQAVRGLLAARRSGNTVWVRSEGSSVQAGASGRHQFGWRDAMDIVVKWRQLSEPNDQVCMDHAEGIL